MRDEKENEHVTDVSASPSRLLFPLRRPHPKRTHQLHGARICQELSFAAGRTRTTTKPTNSVFIETIKSELVF
jgi:hypothetical protein